MSGTRRKRSTRAEKCVHELFEEQVEKSAEAAALVYEDVVLTYAGVKPKSEPLGALSAGVGSEAG